MLQMASKAPIATKSQHVTNGLQMGSKWDPNEIQMGSKWDPNGIQMFQLQQKVTYSRSYLVVKCDINMLQMVSKAPIATKSQLF